MTKAEFIRDFKLQALNNLAHMGVTPSEFGALVKAASFDPTATLKNLTGIAGGALDVGKALAILGLGASGALGVGLGYGANRLVGPDEDDVREAKEQAVIDKYLAAAERQRTENKITQLEQASNVRRKKKLTGLPIPGSTSV